MMALLALLEDYAILERATLRNHAIPVQIQVLTTLGFLATGCFQRELADRSGISQPSLSAIISVVLNAVHDGWLLGDSGYPLIRWLLTPFLNPQSSEETYYNKVHSRARTVVERAIGILKCRCRALDSSGGRLLYHPAKVCKIVRACGVLHNIALRNGIPLPPDLPLPQHYDPEPQPPGRQEGYQQGARIREDVM
ncbi:putative nuclease HARBI1, partial [Tachysurus ichikawai]